MPQTDPHKQILLQDVNQTSKETKIIREQLESISATIQNLQKQTRNLSQTLSDVSKHDLPHSSIATAIASLSEGFSQEQQLLQDVSTKFGFDLVKDLDRFQKQWKLVKTATKQYTKTTLKHRFRKAVSTGTTQGASSSTLNQTQSVRHMTQEEKSKGLLDRQMITALNELYDVAEDTIFTNVFWHAKALESWSNIYEKMAHLDKPSADKEVKMETRLDSEGPSDLDEEEG